MYYIQYKNISNNATLQTQKQGQLKLIYIYEWKLALQPSSPAKLDTQHPVVLPGKVKNSTLCKYCLTQCEQQPGVITLIPAEKVVYYATQQNGIKAGHHNPQLPNYKSDILSHIVYVSVTDISYVIVLSVKESLLLTGLLHNLKPGQRKWVETVTLG